MNPVRTFSFFTSGQATATRTYTLNPLKRYLITGAITKTDGIGYSHAYISELCTGSGDQILCGVRDLNGDDDLRLTEFISNAISVTVKFRSTGAGRRRMEGVLYEL